MKIKKWLSVFLTLSMVIAILPMRVLAEEYCSLKDLANANGYEYFYYDDNETVNVRSASYILSFQNNNSTVAYKTVLDDVGTITLNSNVTKEGDVLYVSKLDAQTKLIKYFPNTTDSAERKESKITPEPVFTKSQPTDWAQSEVNDAIKNNLVTDNVQKNYQADITREYFCELVIKLYEKITGETVTAASNVFKDTSNSEILKAYKLGIVKGVSSTEFAPNSLITRQEICTMLVRAMGTMYENIDTTDYEYHNFNDIGQISSWAMDSVQFAFDNNVMQGVGNNKIDPLGNATCEQAILLVNRIYNNRADFEEKDKDAEDVIETLKRLDFDDNSEVNGVSVSFGDGSDTKGVRIKEIDSDDLIYTTTGIKGSAVNITSSKSFDTATIAFDYNPQGLGSTNANDLAIGWYNTDLDRIEILESKVDTYNHTVSVETTHFSEYILVDSKEWYSVWQRGQTIVRETDNNGRYAENFNVQLVVDCSGSMNGDRIVKARECTYNFIEKLSSNDRFSVIKFSGGAQTVIPETIVANADMSSIKNTIMSLSDGGGTDFDAALNECINTLNTSDDYNNIIVFLSDGESSVSDSLLETLNNSGVRIAAVALGSGSNTSMMQRLSDKTNGQYVYAENSSDLDDIYNAIQGSLIGVDATDTDGDGIPDIVEITGMKNQYGVFIRTDPNLYDTDGDGKSDGEEMGKLIENGEPTEMDKRNGITSCIYFQMVSDPVEGHTVRNYVDKQEMLTLSSQLNIDNSNLSATLDVTVANNGAHICRDVGLEFELSDCLNFELAVMDENGNLLYHAGWDDNGYRIPLAKDLEAGKSVNLKLPVHCDNGKDCSNTHYMKIQAKANNEESEIKTLNISFKENNTPNNSDNSNILDDYEFSMAKYAQMLVEKLYSNADNKSENNETIIEAREAIKKQMSETNLNGNKNATIPNAAYDAFALAIVEALNGSKVNKYETNQNKLAKQIYNQIDKGLSAGTKTVEYDGCSYNVQYNIYSMFGTGVGWQYIDWTTKSGLREKAVLYWENVGTEEGNKALADYCAALAQLNTDLWKDFVAYYISDGCGIVGIEVTKKNVSKILDASERVINALCDKDAADKLVEEMGGAVKDSLKSEFLSNKFKDFVKDNVPNGDKIIDVADKYVEAKKKYDKLTELWREDPNSDQSKKAIEQFEKAYSILDISINGL